MQQWKFLAVVIGYGTVTVVFICRNCGNCRACDMGQMQTYSALLVSTSNADMNCRFFQTYLPNLLTRLCRPLIEMHAGTMSPATDTSDYDALRVKNFRTAVPMGHCCLGCTGNCKTSTY